MIRTQNPQSFVYFALFVLVFTASITHAQEKNTSHKWFVVLPLRFTTLQNTNTMLSGAKLGRHIQPRLNLSLSIYHSFYLKSFKAPAGLPGYTEQPRLYINGMGPEIGYLVPFGKNLQLELQLLAGWGFMNYELKAHGFRSEKVHYLIVEPGLQLEYRTGEQSSVAVGAGYRPLLSAQNITFRSDISSGTMPLHKKLPNGLMITLCLKGFL